MLTRCVRNVASTLKPAHSLRHSRGLGSTSPSEHADQLRTLLQLCVDRYYISAGQTNTDLFQRGMSCSYGPLGMEMRKNLLEQWWHSVTASRVQVFRINTLTGCRSNGDTEENVQFRIVESGYLKEILDQRGLSREHLIQEVQMFLQSAPYVRQNLLQGKLLHNVSIHMI